MPSEAGGPAPWECAGSRVGEELIGPDGGVMVWVPPGEFLMGSTDADVRYALGNLGAGQTGMHDEQPAHWVHITRGFWIGKHEVTNEQFRAFCEATLRHNLIRSDAAPRQPVVGVFWGQAKAYCDHYGLALPTEAQWEYAARGPRNLRYPWGNDWDGSRCCNTYHMPKEASSPGGECREDELHYVTGPAWTMDVGSLPAGDSWCGACDMAGNVWELCADWYGPDYYSHTPECDPPGPASGERRIVRGGSWLLDACDCRSAYRGTLDPECGVNDVGFRVCKTPGPPARPLVSRRPALA